MRISRRSFLGTSALAPLAANLAAGAEIGKTGPLPKRALGRTGAHVSILAMGGGSRFLMYKDEDKALEALNRAFDLGITYMDTAFGYGSGLSETRVGKVMAVRRKKDGIFLATKIEARNGDEAARTVEGSKGVVELPARAVPAQPLAPLRDIAQVVDVLVGET